MEYQVWARCAEGDCPKEFYLAFYEDDWQYAEKFAELLRFKGFLDVEVREIEELAHA